jgi:hypothetical protein
VPEQGYDDYAGLDLKGKIAVTLAGSPEPMSAALGAHYQTAAERWKALKEKRQLLQALCGRKTLISRRSTRGRWP